MSEEQNTPTSGLKALIRLPRTLSQLAQFALGARGIAWAAGAALVALVCCTVSVADIVLSQHTTDLDREQRDAEAIRAVDDASGRVVRNALAMAQIYLHPADGRPALRESWTRFSNALDSMCTRLDSSSPPLGGLRHICATRQAFYTDVVPEIAAFEPPGHPFDRAIGRELIAAREEIAGMSRAMADNANSLVAQMAAAYRRALWVLAASVAGFVGASGVLVILIASASTKYRDQWRKTREARDLLHETIEAVPAGIVLFDRDERLMMFNSAAAASTPLLRRPGVIGISYEALARETAKLVEEFGNPLLNAPAEWVARFRSKGAQRMRQPVGERWFEWSEQLTASGRTVGLRVDITDLKRHETELEAARAEYQSLVDSLSDVVFKFDLRDGNITFINAAAARLFGRPVAELSGTPFLDLVAPEYHTRALEIAREDARSAAGTVREHQVRMRAAGNVWRHVEVRFGKTTGPNGRQTITGVIRDVEDRVRLETQLAQEMGRLRSIVESSGAIVLLVDRDLRVLMANRGFMDLHRLAMEEVVGRPLGEIIQVALDPSVLERWRAGPLAPADTEPVRYSKTCAGSDGRERIYSITARPIVDEKWVTRQIVFLGFDDTERREAEQALADAERLATVGEMAATVAHEINQPLQVIHLACASALDELGEPAASGAVSGMTYVKSKLDRIVQQVGRATRIVGDLRNFVRDTSTDAPTPFDPAEALRNAVELASHTLRTSFVTLSSSVTERLPPVFGHAGRLEQVLINLINNARDAGAPTIEVAADTIERNGQPFVRIAVQDSGQGIAPEILPRLFVNFVTTKPRGMGTGLGLRICRRIVEEMGGVISAANRPEGGARFEIMLPVAR